MRPAVLTSAPTTVFFDAVGTLIHPEPAAPLVYADVGRRYGSRLDVNAIAARFRDAFRRQEAIDRVAGWRTDERRAQARWHAIVSETLVDVSDADACFHELYRHFARPDAWRANADAGPTLRTLAEAGWHIGLASNFDSRLRSVAAGLPELASVSTMVVSAEIGWRKPAAEFFREVGRQAQSDLQKIVYIGDDPANDYHGAAAAGLNALLFDPQQRCKDALVRRIVCLGDLLTITA